MNLSAIKRLVIQEQAKQTLCKRYQLLTTSRRKKDETKQIIPGVLPANQNLVL